MASSRLGLRGARDVLFAGIRAATTQRIPSVNWTFQPQCLSPSVRRYGRPPKINFRDAEPPRSPRAQMAEAQALQSMSAADVAMILPGTLVAPPLSQYPKNPREFLRFVREVFIIWARTRASSLGICWGSKPSLFKKAQFKLNNTAALLEAKALHRTMAEALAEGDKNTLSRICTKLMANPMMAAIDARPRTRRFRWELLEYHSSARNPRIASQMIAPTSASANSTLLRQLVVSIWSKQRRTEEARGKDGSWQVVPGGEKVVDVRENLVLVSTINPKTWQQGEWRILGTIPTMTPADWYAEKRTLEMLEREHFKAKLQSKY